MPQKTAEKDIEDEYENQNQQSKEIFVKIIRYSTPMTVAILLYVGIVALDAEPTFMIPIGILVVVEILMGVKADKLYDLVSESEDQTD